MRLSLVIPAYREAGRMADTLHTVCAYLDHQSYDWEVLVVIDGDSDGAAAAATAAAGERANVRVLVNEVNRGKGFSVRRGFARPPATAWSSSMPTSRCRSKACSRCSRCLTPEPRW